MFFITGHGRSGTVFLADLLGKSENGHVFHESPFLDQDAFVEAFKERRELSQERLNLIKTRREQQVNLVYGEVNGYLRYYISPLLKLTPQIYHLVRDGKDVIRSMMNRNSASFTVHDSNRTQFIYPYGDDPYVSEWSNMDRFERLCWYWQHGIMEVCNYKIPILHFEKILVDYDYLTIFLNSVGLDLPFEVWNYERRILKNETPRHNRKFPEYLNWSNKQKESFKRICGKSMEIIGYVI